MREYTVKDWFEQWLSVYKHGTRDTTRELYRQTYFRYVDPMLGASLLSEVGAIDAQRALNLLQDKGISYSVRSKVRSLMLSLFEKALLDGLIPRNPVKQTHVKPEPRAERVVLTPTEQELFFLGCKNTFYEDLFVVAVSTGLRIGELTALRWEDIDMENQCIHVSRTLIVYTNKQSRRNANTYAIHPPKTSTSNRTVYWAGNVCTEALRRQHARKLNVASSPKAEKIPGFEDLLFVTRHNSPIAPDVCRSAIHTVVDRVNLTRKKEDHIRYFSAHTFRHTYATRCFEAGVDPKVIQHQLGHSTLHMTMDLYTHLLDDKRTAELAKLNNLPT